MSFMNKVVSAVEHWPATADKLFRQELYGVPHWFLVDCTDEKCYGTKSSMQEWLPSCQQQLLNALADHSWELVIVFYNYVIRLAKGFNRLDAVFYCYFRNSLKTQIRKGWGLSGTWVLQITDDVSFPRQKRPPPLVFLL